LTESPTDILCEFEQVIHRWRFHPFSSEIDQSQRRNGSRGTKPANRSVGMGHVVQNRPTVTKTLRANTFFHQSRATRARKHIRRKKVNARARASTL
jgi:hypothetical protein